MEQEILNRLNEILVILSEVLYNSRIARKGVTGDVFINEANATGTIYDDDGITPLSVHNLFDDQGNPAIFNVHERRQQLTFTVPDAIAPVLQSATVEDATPTVITLTYDEALNTGSVPAISDFVASGGKAVSSIQVTGTTVLVTVDAAYAASDAITISYTPGSNPIQDVAGNDAIALVDQAVTNNIVPLARVISLGAGEEFSAAVPSNAPCCSEDGTVHTVFRTVAGSLRAVSVDTANGDQVTDQAAVNITGLNSSGRTYSIVYGYDNGQWRAWALVNRGDANAGGASFSNEYMKWYRWDIDSSGTFSNQIDGGTLPGISAKEAGFVRATPGDLGTFNLVSALLGIVHGQESGATAGDFATRTAALDLQSGDGLGGGDLTGIGYPELCFLARLIDGWALLVFDNGDFTTAQNANTGSFQELTRSQLAGGSWSAEVTPVPIDSSSGEGDFTDANYALGLSHAGQVDIVQLDDGTTVLVYISNEDQVNGLYGRARLMVRGNAIASDWSVQNLDAVGTRIKHVTLSTDGVNVWIQYMKFDSEELAYRVWDSGLDTYSPEVVVGSYNAPNVLNRMASTYRTPVGVPPTVSATLFNGSTYEHLLGICPLPA